MLGLVRYGLATVVLAACHTGASPGADSGQTPAGLFVHWSTQPQAIPGDVGSNVTIRQAVFLLDYLRVIGDAGLTDTRTTAIALRIEWGSGTRPDDVPFTMAPTGLYSKVQLVLDGHLIDNSIHIEGTVVVSGNTRAFEIEDRNGLLVSLNIQRMLQPGETATIGLEVDFANALSGIDWTTLPYDDGRLHLDNQTSGSQLDAFEQHLTESFKVQDAPSL